MRVQNINFCVLSLRQYDRKLPSYVSASLCADQTSRTLLSSNKKLLKIPKRCLKSFGERSFSFIAPSVWNSLPTNRRIQTQQFNIFSFRQAFSLTQADHSCDHRLCIFLRVYTCVCTSALSFCFTKRFAHYKSHELLLLFWPIGLSSVTVVYNGVGSRPVEAESGTFSVLPHQDLVGPAK